MLLYFIILQSTEYKTTFVNSMLNISSGDVLLNGLFCCVTVRPINFYAPMYKPLSTGSLLDEKYVILIYILSLIYGPKFKSHYSYVEMAISQQNIFLEAGAVTFVEFLR